MQWDVFQDVEVAFLPVGHTHEDIDQVFSCTAARSKHENAISWTALHSVVRRTYNEFTVVSHLRNIANWSALCEQERCLTHMVGFTEYRYFRFGIAKSGQSLELENLLKTDMVVKKKCEYKRKPFKPSTVLHNGFIRFAPDISRTPATIISCPTGREEVMKRVQSEEGRIGSRREINELMDIVHFVFQNRTDQFH